MTLCFRHAPITFGANRTQRASVQREITVCPIPRARLRSQSHCEPASVVPMRREGIVQACGNVLRQAAAAVTAVARSARATSAKSGIRFPASQQQPVLPGLRLCHGFREAVGSTPLLMLRSASEETGCTIWGKCEFLNPGGSVKDRPAVRMLKKAEKAGKLLLTTSRVYSA